MVAVVLINSTKQVMKVRAMTFGGKENLTKDHIQFGLAVAPSMSRAEANRIILEDIRAVLKTLSLASEAPSMDAVRQEDLVEKS